MTYRELFYKATRLINNDQITLGEYEEMTKPLDREIEQEDILNKLRVEINKNIEQEDFARSVFLYEEKDLDRANKCVGILEAYKKVLDMINNLLKENKDV